MSIFGWSKNLNNQEILNKTKNYVKISLNKTEWVGQIAGDFLPTI